MVLAFFLGCAGPQAERPDGPAGPAPAPAPAPSPMPSPEPTTPPANGGALEICVNELMPDNEHGWIDETGADADWIELHNPGSHKVDLDGWRIGDDANDRDGTPLDGLSIPAGGYLVLAADGTPKLGPTHLGFSLAAGGDAVALWAPDDRGAVVVYGAMSADRALARETDCCDPAERSCWMPTVRPTPGESNAGSLLPTVLVARDASWRYLDGSAAPGLNWFSAGYDDSGWPEGAAPLGYGEPVVTTLDGGDPSNRPAAAYFRTDFDVVDPTALTALRMRIRYDDGAVIYLNGTRLFGSGAPEVVGGYASALREPPVESRFHEVEGWRQAVVPGENVLGVVVHQGAADSDDLWFELELRVAP